MISKATAGLALIFSSCVATAQVSLGALKLVTSHAQGAGFFYGSKLEGGFSMSDDGRFVAFAARGRRIATPDDNQASDVFVKDTQDNTVEMVSRGLDGAQLSSKSLFPRLSGDGRYVAFMTGAAEVGGAPDHPVICIRDRVLQTTAVVSHAADGGSADGACVPVSLSADGRTLLFTSRATNLLPVALPDRFQRLYVLDVPTQQTSMVSVTSQGVPANGEVFGGTMSDDGRFVAFASRAENLVGNDITATAFLHDRQTGRTKLISVADELFDSVGIPVISGDGRLVVYRFRDNTQQLDSTRIYDRLKETTVESFHGDNGFAFSRNHRYLAVRSGRDILLRDLQTSQELVVSRAPQGDGANRWCRNPIVSNDGRFVAFESIATNLSPKDQNVVADIYLRFLPGAATP